MTQLTGALARAFLVVALVAMPALLLPETSADTAIIVALVALVSAAFVVNEYTSTAPSLIEFRDAPPFNRIRFGAMLATVFLLSLVLRGQTDPNTLTRLVTLIGEHVGRAADFPYSPVRLVLLMLPDDAHASTKSAVRICAGLSYLISLLGLCLFVLTLKLRGWPNRFERFNVWVNLPMFDPTAGGDVIQRMRRDSQINLILGFLLPFMIPAFVKLASALISSGGLHDPHRMIWILTAWAFIPASLLMRGIALNRIAEMISLQRARSREIREGKEPPLVTA